MKFWHIKHKKNSEELHNCLEFLNSSQKELHLAILDQVIFCTDRLQKIFVDLC